MKNDRTNRWASLASSLALASALALPAIAMPTAAHAQEGVQRFDIAAGDLSRALQDYSAATGVQLVYSSELVADKRSPGVSGSLSRGDALARLLGGTGLMAKISGNSATITPIADAVAPGEGERVLGAVRVEGERGSGSFGVAGQQAGVNGINGSRDITATEGTGSYTTGATSIGSKYPAALKEIPQSVSVLTSERIKDQNIQSLEDAMRQTAGISVIQGGNSIEPQFYSRGFRVESLTIDGGAPQNIGSTPFLATSALIPTLDMSLYDHIEVLRGAAGTFNGYGNPGGTINLTRKRPLDHEQFQFELQVGSWNDYRASLDASAPLALDGALRGRIVTTWQSNQHFYDIAKDKKTIVYGIVELDATPSTLLSTGASYTQQDSIIWKKGLPRFRDGRPLGVSRSTALTLPWSRMSIDTIELFGEVNQSLGDTWNTKLKYTYTDQDRFEKIADVGCNTAVDPVNFLGCTLGGGRPASSREKQHGIDFNISGSFEAFGFEQKILVGASYASNDGGGQTIAAGGFSYQFNGAPFGGLPIVNPFDFNSEDSRYAEPAAGEPLQKIITNRTENILSFIKFDAQLLNGLHIISAINYSETKARYLNRFYCAGYIRNSNQCGASLPGELIPPPPLGTADNFIYKGRDFSWPPSLSVRYDILPSLSSYAGYTDIYVDQSRNLTKDMKAAPPLTGGNFEGGVRWSPRDGKLNLSLSGYYIRRKGVLMPDSTVPGATTSDNRFCCYVVDPNRKDISYGFDAELVGELRPGLQVSASYTFNKNEYKGQTDPNFGGRVPAISSFAPRHLYKLWATYDFGAAGASGALRKLTMGMGLNGQSSTYRTGYVCTDFGPPNADGIPACLPGYDFANGKFYEGVPYEFTEKGWIVASASLQYRLNERFDMTLNIENIFDKTYYQTVGILQAGNWYGSPRSFALSLRGKW